jgi:hypothetical protein
MSKAVPSQNRVVLAGAITKKKNHPAGKGHPDSGLRGRIITQQALDHGFSDVHGKVTRESSLPLALESAQAFLNLGTAGTSEKRFSGQDPEFFSRILRIMTLAQHRAEAVISSACFPFCGLGVLKL